MHHSRSRRSASVRVRTGDSDLWRQQTPDLQPVAEADAVPDLQAVCQKNTSIHHTHRRRGLLWNLPETSVAPFRTIFQSADPGSGRSRLRRRTCICSTQTACIPAETARQSGSAEAEEVSRSQRARIWMGCVTFGACMSVWQFVQVMMKRVGNDASAAAAARA